MNPADLKKLAVFIDSENVSASHADEILGQVKKLGRMTIGRAFADWTTTNQQGWKKVLQRFGLQPMQQFSCIKGKKSTDSALIIDAMDVLHTCDVDGFCIVSSDSDFTRLALRIRESGKMVYGMGHPLANAAFICACDEYFFFGKTPSPVAKPSKELTVPHPASHAPLPPFSEKLLANPVIAGLMKTAGNPPPAPLHMPDPSLPNLREILIAAIENAKAKNESGWAAINLVGTHIKKQHPAFKPTSYRFKNLMKLLEGQDYLEIQPLPSGSNAGCTNVRVKMLVGADAPCA